MNKLTLNKRTLNKYMLSAIGAAFLGVSGVQAQDTSPVIIGKNNDWLFISYEFGTAADTADTQATVDLLTKANKLFESKGITLALVIVPSKIRIHADQLPPNKPLDSYTADKYENVVKTLTAGGVNVVNLNQAFLASPHRSSDTPIFLRLDTHWSHTGSMLAAEAVKAAIDANPRLKSALAATPEEKYDAVWSKGKVNQRVRDLVRLLPAGAPSYPPEQAMRFSSVKANASQAGLLGGGDNVGITVIGSSYTNKAASFPDALRYTLQRDMLDISIPVDQGPWVGMDAYLKDEAFKTRPPKLIIWEIPEREFRSPPNYKHRDPRYVIDNNAWIQRIAASLK